MFNIGDVVRIKQKSEIDFSRSNTRHFMWVKQFENLKGSYRIKDIDKDGDFYIYKLFIPADKNQNFWIYEDWLELAEDSYLTSFENLEEDDLVKKRKENLVKKVLEMDLTKCLHTGCSNCVEKTCFVRIIQELKEELKEDLLEVM